MLTYSQPAAANYMTAPLHSPRKHEYRICDQCGTSESPAVKFRLCGGCMTAHYCSPDCQRGHWPSHKPICQHTASSRSRSKTAADGRVDENVAKHLRKFTLAHSSLLGWAGFQALQLKRIPANVKENALLIELSYQSHVEPHRRFSVASTRVVPRSYIRDPLIISDIQRREERCQKNGGIGTLVVVIQCGSTSQVIPIEVDPPAKINWDSRDDWAQVLSHFIDNGRTDFLPIPATPRGVVYYAPLTSINGPHSPQLPLVQSVGSQLHGKKTHPHPLLTHASPNPEISKLATEVKDTRAGAGDIDPSSHSSINSPGSSPASSVPSPITPSYLLSDSNTDPDTQGNWNQRVDTTGDPDKEEVTCRFRESPPDMVDIDEEEQFQTTTCWIAAEHALQHARSNISSVSEVFDMWHIPKSEYIVLAGFDESLIRSGVGYLEQIHVFTSAEVDAASPLLSELGRLFSPFSSVLFTNFSSYRMPVFKADGGVWEFDELVYCNASKFTDGGLSAKMPLTVISLSQTPSLTDAPNCFSEGTSGSGEGGKSEKEKGKERDKNDENEADKEDKDDDDDPDEPSGNRGGIIGRQAKISFAIVSKIYPIQDKLTAFQTLTMQGSLTIKTTRPAPQSPDPFSTCRVRFTDLTFGTRKTMEIAYTQFHVRIIINSQDKNAGVEGIRPKRTLASEREEKQLSVTKRGQTRGMAVGLTIGPNPQGAITGAAAKTKEETAGIEKKRYTSRITEQHDDGIIEWGFNVDDLHERERGIDMSPDVLPTVCFEFVGDPKVPPPPPECMSIDITSYWSMIPRSGTESNWIHTFLNVPRSSDNTQATSYSNLCQIVALETVPSDLPPRSDYRATMHVSPGVPDMDYISYYPDVRLPTADSVTVTPAFTTDDWRKLNTLRSPTHTEFKLSDYLRQTFAKSGSDSKSQ